MARFNKQPMNKETYELREVLAVAVAVNELNIQVSPETNGYVKSSFPVLRGILGAEKVEVDVPEGYDFAYDEDLFVFSNRDLLKEHFGMGTLNKWHPEKNNIPTFTVTDEHRAEADKIIKHFNKLMFDALAGNLDDNGFKSALYELFNKEDGKIMTRDFGLTACVPSAYLNDLAAEKRKKNERELAKVSTYIGGVGGKVDVEIDVVSSKFIEKFGCYVYNCIEGGQNAVSFFTQKDPNEFGKRCRITGKVKRTDVSNYSGAKETTLNYVKVTEVLEK